MATNLALDVVRRRSTARRFRPALVERPPPSADDDRRLDLQAALRQLPRRQRQVMDRGHRGRAGADPRAGSRPPGRPPPGRALRGGLDDVVFSAGSDDGAFDVSATGTDCATSRVVAAGADGAGVGAFYTAAGFRCDAITKGDSSLPAYRHHCAGSLQRVVTFTRT